MNKWAYPPNAQACKVQRAYAKTETSEGTCGSEPHHGGTVIRPANIFAWYFEVIHEGRRRIVSRVLRVCQQGPRTKMATVVSRRARSGLKTVVPIPESSLFRGYGAQEWKAWTSKLAWSSTQREAAEASTLSHDSGIEANGLKRSCESPLGRRID